MSSISPIGGPASVSSDLDLSSPHFYVGIGAYSVGQFSVESRKTRHSTLAIRHSIGGFMTSDQLQAIGLLVSGLSSEQTAKKIGVCSRTLRRWKKEPEFAEELRELLEDIDTSVRASTLNLVRKSHQLTNKSYLALNEMLDDANASVRLRASNTLINASLKWARVLTFTRSWFEPGDEVPRSPGVPPGEPSASPDMSAPPTHSKPDETPDKSGHALRNPGVVPPGEPTANPAEKIPSPAVQHPAEPGPSSSPGVPPGQSTTTPDTSAPPTLSQPLEKPDKSGHPRPWQKPPHVPFYKNLKRRR
jgi:hypothetical protein